MQQYDGPSDCHTEWTKSDRKAIFYGITYVWNLKKKWYKWTYLQNRVTDGENKLMVTKPGCEEWVKLELTYMHHHI